jgi:imidazolonepropionase-like amidohydrolase
MPRPIYRLLCAVALLALPTITLWAHPQIPGAPQTHPIALVDVAIHPVNGAEIARGTVLFDQGKLVAIGETVELPEEAESISLPGKHVYPGLFDAYTQMGLVEFPSVRATIDERETGTINPNAAAQVAINPDSELIPVARSNGILTVLSAPIGGLISGTSAVVQLDGWTWEEMTLKAPVGTQVNWPKWVPVFTWLTPSTEQVQSERREKALADLQQALADARAYDQARQVDPQKHPRDARWEALARLTRGEVPLIVEADELQQIQSAVAFSQREGLKLILVGGYDAPLCIDLLKQAGVSVIVGGVHRLPQRPGDPYDHPFTVPARLHAAGIPFCIASRNEAARVRNLPYHAGTAAAYGLPAAEALRAVTLSPAEILGVADRIGSLEVGKDATLIVTDGDPLETPTQIERAFIQGREVDLNDKQKRLWQKYQEKYRRQGLGG